MPNLVLDREETWSRSSVVECPMFNSRNRTFEEKATQSPQSNYTSLRDLEVVSSNKPGMLYGQTGAPPPPRRSSSVVFKGSEMDEGIYVELFWI